MRTLVDVLMDSSSRFGEVPAYCTSSDERGGLVYNEVGSKARKIAQFLRQHGVSTQAKVCIYAPNSPEWTLAFWGIIAAGCVVVPVDPNSGTTEINHILRDTKAKWVFVTRKAVGNLSGLELEGMILVDGVTEADAGQVSLDEILEGSEGGEVASETTQEDPAVIIYTSGTTMAPKGVVLSHQGILSNLSGILEVLKLDGNDRFLSVISLSHTFEITCGLILPFMVGARVMYARSLKYTDVFRDMQTFAPTTLLCVPMMFRILLENLTQRISGTRCLCLSEVEKNEEIREVLCEKGRQVLGGSVRYFVSGGAPLAKAIVAGYEEIGVPLLQAYGLTETSGVSTLTVPGDFPRGSVGRSLRNIEVRIDEPNPDGIGEVCIRGDHLMLGYHNNEKATREMIRDRWLHSGDVGRLDEEGNLFITGRTKNVIVTAAGVNVYPEELETRIIQSPFIKDICVIGKQRPDRTETVFASVVADEDYLKSFLATQKKKGITPPSLSDIIWKETESYTTDLASYKRIVGIQIRRRSFPRGRTKKIIRERVKKESFSILGRLGKFDESGDQEFPIVFINATAITPFRIAPKSCVVIEDGKISQLGSFDSVYLPPNARVIDLEGRYLLPGFIDLHVHGGKGFDFSDTSQEELETILDYFVSHGTTHLLATLYPDKKRTFLKAIQTLASRCRKKPRRGVLHGIHIEGPFLNKAMSGALNAEYFWDATIDNMLLLEKTGRGFIKLMTVAPEIPGGQDVMQVAAQEDIILCIAHSDAFYKDIEEAIDLGLSQVTHIFNAMAPMHHRKPGTVTAALLRRELKVHLIADGFHVHPAVVNLLYRLKGPSGIILISDAIAASGQKDGPYVLADQSVTVKRGRAYLADGTLAGSTTTLDKSLMFMAEKTDIPFQEAVRMATLNPARVLGLDHSKGILAIGKDADLVVMNQSYGVDMTLIEGEVLYATPPFLKQCHSSR